MRNYGKQSEAIWQSMQGIAI
ncbi:hypothetical protein [Serratia symbiotica]|nr:hypothetical protein [Serratia symbiotica]